MNNKDNIENNIEDNIRAPDPVIHEQLVENNISEFDIQISHAINQSLKDICESQDLNIEFERKIVNDYCQEKNRRNQMFKDFLFNLNKISKFDKEIRDITEIIEPIIECYCEQIIEFYRFDKNTYDKIFGILKKIRNSNSILDILKSIILIDE